MHFWANSAEMHPAAIPPYRVGFILMRKSRPPLEVRLKCSTLFARYDRRLLKIGQCLALPRKRS